LDPHRREEIPSISVELEILATGVAEEVLPPSVAGGTDHGEVRGPRRKALTLRTRWKSLEEDRGGKGPERSCGRDLAKFPPEEGADLDRLLEAEVLDQVSETLALDQVPVRPVAHQVA
jgi:hypothetical protein